MTTWNLDEGNLRLPEIPSQARTISQMKVYI